ncbi:calcyphosin-2-like isoform X1 [Montipora capricornis]|uniref:calcyphosin-2-like isoform X1 n=1 Tax=Montipora capricornis TaxID=246305 RepID=UPI0035F134E6
MSFWRTNSQPDSDLSVTGKSTFRHQRPLSGHRVRGGSTKSHIFGISDTPSQGELTRKNANSLEGNTASAATSSVHITPEAPRPSSGHPPKIATGSNANVSVISKSQLDNAKKLAESRSNYADQPVEVQVFSRNQMVGRKAPKGVPQLDLGGLADDNNQLLQPLTVDGPYLHTPDSCSSVSWGTPLHSTRFHPVRPGKPKGGDLQSFQAGATCVGNGERNVHHEKQFEELQSEQANTSYPVENANVHSVTDQYERPWSTQPATQWEQAQFKRRQEEEVLHSEKKKDVIVETILVDQLSRAAVSDPEKNASSIPADLGPKERKQMEFYNTRSPNKGPNTENALSKRVRFGARIVTKNGRDAHRELNGFFFSADNTLTLYEFHQFGTRSSALPFIQRGSYSHVQGRKKGQPYTLLDICVGANLSFMTASQTSLPQTVSSRPVVVFRICDVDVQARESQLFENCQSFGDKRSLMEKLANPISEEELQQTKILENVQCLVKKQLQKRAVKTLMGLGQHFRKLDQSGDGLLDRQELLRALETYHIKIPKEVFDDLWDALDVNADGFLDYGEFSRGFIGEMSELRKSLVRKVFRKLDPSKTGVVNLNNMRKFYCTKKHPKVVSGEAKEWEIEESFLNSFELCTNRGQVTFAEFEDYYEGVSIGFESDEEFTAMMRNCWGV